MTSSNPKTASCGFAESPPTSALFGANGRRALLLAILVISALPAVAAERQRLSTSVLVIEPPPPAETLQVAGQAVTQPPIEDLYRARSADSRADIRFAILLPEHPVTVGVRVWIDGQLFADAREEAVESLLRANQEDTDGDASDTPDGLLSRFTEYVRVTGRTPSRNEIRWLMQKWELGPRVLEWRTAFQASMRSRAPVFEVIDKDQNDILTEDEVALAARTLQTADSDRDAVLEMAEISRMAKRRPRVGWQSRRLLVSLDEAKTELTETYTPDVLTALAAGLQSEPDLVICVRFDTRNREASTLEVTAPRLNIARSQQGAGAIELEIGGATLLISAAQPKQSGATEPLSIGASASSAALFDRLDSNHDGRLTVRELRQTAVTIETLDRNTDGQISAAELPELVHFGVGLGPIVHQYLENFRSPRPRRPSAPTSWFDRMDRNRDGDLSWSEFLGDKDQFRAMDIDEDGLIGRNEAHRGQQSDE